MGFSVLDPYKIYEVRIQRFLGMQIRILKLKVEIGKAFLFCLFFIFQLQKLSYPSTITFNFTMLDLDPHFECGSMRNSILVLITRLHFYNMRKGKSMNKYLRYSSTSAFLK